MNKFYLIAILLFFSIESFAQSFNYEEQDTFFTNLQEKLKKDFIECTGDTAVPELKYLLEWKNRIHLQTQTNEYKEILKEYMVMKGILDSIIPCHVLEWHKSRIKFLNTNEKKVEAEILELNDKIVDSIGFLNEHKKNPSSKYDFEEIPFGFSLRYFLQLYNSKFSSSPLIYDNILLSEHFFYSETPFILKFYFDKEQRFYKYEIESYAHSGDDLNTKVRPAAEILIKQMETNAGKPDKLNRVGYFDIKPERKSLLASWNSESINAQISYAIKDSKYYTILSVEKNLNF